MPGVAVTVGEQSSAAAASPRQAVKLIHEQPDKLIWRSSRGGHAVRAKRSRELGLPRKSFDEDHPAHIGG